MTDWNAATVLTVPGLDGSGANHWQTIWEHTRDDVFRVELGQWERPHRNSWITRLDHAIRAVNGPVILAAHSLGCIAVAWWAAFAGRLPGSKVIGALLVAPCDVDRCQSERVTGFAPVPARRLPFPSLVVASSNDPWIAPDRAQELATRWGSGFVDAGALGHINADSDLGAWDEGQRLVAALGAFAFAQDRVTDAARVAASASTTVHGVGRFIRSGYSGPV